MLFAAAYSYRLQRAAGRGRRDLDTGDDPPLKTEHLSGRSGSGDGGGKRLSRPFPLTFSEGPDQGMGAAFSGPPLFSDRIFS